MVSLHTCNINNHDPFEEKKAAEKFVMKHLIEYFPGKEQGLASKQTGKKEWRRPLISELDLLDTKGGDRDMNIELEFFFISFHS